MKTNTHFLSYLAQLFLEWNIFQTKVVEKLETRILWSITFFFENRTFSKIMWKSFVEQSRSEMIIWRIRILFRILKATHSHTGCVIFIASPLQQWLHERTSKLRYTYTACHCYVTLCSSAGAYENFKSPFCWSSGYEIEPEGGAEESSKDPGTHIPDMINWVFFFISSCIQDKCS